MSEFQIYSPGSASKRAASPSSPVGTYNQISPTKYDVDFYRRKAERLQEDLFTVGDELNKARLRLRRAEDYELKCQILIKQKCLLESTVGKRDQQIHKLVSEKETLLLQVKHYGSRSHDNHFQKQRLIKDLQLWKEKALQAEQVSRRAVVEEESRGAERVEQEVALMKRTLGQAQEQYKFQIGRLAKQLSERQGTDMTVNTRNDRQAKQRERQIVRLEGVVGEMRGEYMSMVQQKNKQIESVRYKFQQIMNTQLGSIHKNMGSQDSRFKLELQGLRKVIDLKNQDISNLQQQLKTSLEDYATKRQQLNAELQLFKNKLYEKDRENTEELINMKERLAALHAADLASIRQHYQDLIDNLKDERKESEKLMGQKDSKVEYQMRQFDKGQMELNHIIQDKDREIKDLRQRLSMTGQSSTSEIGNLQQTLSKYADQKQTLNNQYQSNISFLNQQISKLTTSSQLKNNEIKELHQYIAILKKQHFEGVKDLEAKWKQERKERESERERERDRREAVEEEFREKHKIWKNSHRELQMDLQKQKRQKSKWSANNQKLEKEVQRLYKEIGDLQQNCKSQFNKNQSAVVSGGGSKRQLIGQLQRQKGDFQALKRMETDQAKKRYDLEVLRLTNQNQKLSSQLSSKRIDYQKLQDEFRKVSSQYKNIQKLNRDKMADYQQKMSSLNSQILLTQNLYQSLVNAKSKVSKKQE